MKYAKADARPARLPDARVLELSSEGLDRWYYLHAGESLTCCCSLMGPEETCDRGQALYRLSKSAKAGKLDAHTDVAA